VKIPVALRLPLALVAIVSCSFLATKWQGSSSEIDTTAKSGPMAEGLGSDLPQDPIDRISFYNSLFTEIKPSDRVAQILTSDPNTWVKDSLEYALSWARETENSALAALLMADLADHFGDSSKHTEVARNLVFSAAENIDIPTASAFLFQQGKIWIDRGLEKNPKDIDLRNALIIYQSEYLNAPMQFLGTLRETLAMDSSNIETHFIHLNLLKKSQQWQKALDKCQKLVSLQPQNPFWLYQTSDLYGFLGDSTNAKIFLDLAVKAQRTQNQTN
jgi:tetratricopeptide (TPR) repeat protein